MILSLKNSLGIEIRENDLLMVSMKKGLKQSVVSAYKIIANYKQVTRSELRHEVQRFAISSGANREQIILGIPREQAIVRLIELPRDVEENLDQVMKFQVENLTPMEDVMPYFDYAVLNRQGTHMQILLVMVKKELLDEHLAFIHTLGVQPNTVQLSTVGLSNLALTRPTLQSDAIHLHFSIGEKKLELLGIKNRQLWYSKHLYLTEDVPTPELLSDEIDSALASMRLEDGRIEKIWFSGKDAEALLPDFRSRVPESDYATKNLALELPKGMPPFLANDLACVIGLAQGALSKKPPVPINLLPKEKRVHYNKWSFAPTVILGLAILGLALAPTVIHYRQDKRFLDQLNVEIKKLEPEINQIKQWRKENESLEKKVAVLEELTARCDNQLDILKDLTVRLADNTHITTYRFSKGELNIGFSSQVGATVIVKKLAECPFLRDVEHTSEYSDPATGRKSVQVKAKVKKEC